MAPTTTPDGLAHAATMTLDEADERLADGATHQGRGLIHVPASMGTRPSPPPAGYGSWIPWRSVPAFVDVGVVTVPAARRSGIGRAVVASVARAVLRRASDSWPFTN